MPKSTEGKRSRIALRPEMATMAWMIAQGATFPDLAKAFNITANRARILTSTTRMQEEIERARVRIYGNPSQRIKAIVPEAIESDYQIMKDERNKANVRHAVAKNFMEQGMGKPKQVVELDGGFTIRTLYEKLDQIRPKKSKPVPIEVESVKELPPAKAQSNVTEFLKDLENSNED